jgi:hypothetical protein
MKPTPHQIEERELGSYPTGATSRHPIVSQVEAISDLSSDQFDRVLALVAAISQSGQKKGEAKYLTVQDAADYCRVAVQTIYNNRRHIERMPGVRKLLFTREALDRWLAMRRSARRKRG